ncbi:MAG: hypothetical protein ACR2FY_07635 [Pirellulaceae bacterium]
MATAVQGAIPAADRQWYIVERWQEYEGEGRTNLLRILAIGVFYLVELAQYHWFQPAGVDAAELTSYHQKVTALAVASTMVALAVMLCLRMRVFPEFLKYVSTGCDLLLLTAVASVDHGASSTAADGPASPLVLIFFLILALAALRFSLGLVWFATLGSMLGYLVLVGLADKKWFDQDHAVPMVTQAITVLSLGLTGIVLGQIIRRVRSLAEEYAHRMAKERVVASP